MRRLLVLENLVSKVQFTVNTTLVQRHNVPRVGIHICTRVTILNLGLGHFKEHCHYSLLQRVIYTFSQGTRFFLIVFLACERVSRLYTRRNILRPLDSAIFALTDTAVCMRVWVYIRERGMCLYRTYRVICKIDSVGLGSTQRRRRRRRRERNFHVIKVSFHYQRGPYCV